MLLGFCLNDVTERYTSLTSWGGGRFFMANVDTTRSMSWMRRLWHRSATRQAMLHVVRDSAKRGEMYRVGKLWSDPDAPHIADAWRVVFGEVDQLAEAVHSSGARFAVVVFPYADQLARDGGFDAPQRALTGHLRSRGIPYVDLLKPARGSGMSGREMFLDENHFSPTGAEWAAEQIVQFLVEHLEPA